MHYPLAVLVLSVLTDAPAPAKPVLTVTAPANVFRVLEGKVYKDLMDGQLNDFKLLEAALVINGIEKTERIDALIADLKKRSQSLGSNLPEEEEKRARAIFDWLHAEMLKGAYQASCSDLAKAIRFGDYNCVTATLLYYWLCERHDVPCHLLAAPSHVLAEIHSLTPSRVETTCKKWFELSPENQVNRYASLRVLTEVQFLAKLYYNRGVNQLDERKFSDAIVSFRRSVELDRRDEAARENILAAYNNWALAECDGKNFGFAIKVLEEGIRLDPNYKPFRANDLHIHQKWVIALCRDRKYSRAIDVLQSCFNRRPDAELFAEGRLSVFRDWSNHAMREGRVEEAIEVLNLARKNAGNHKQFAEYERAMLEEGRQILARSRRVDPKAVAQWRAMYNGNGLEESGDSNLTIAAP